MPGDGRGSPLSGLCLLTSVPESGPVCLGWRGAGLDLEG